MSPPRRAIRVTWTEATPVANRICQDGYAFPCVTTTVDDPDSVLVSVDSILEAPVTRIAVVALGTPDSEPGLSPVFDSLRARDPVVAEVRPTSDGHLVLSWEPGVEVYDVTPGDPLDVVPPEGHVYRVGAVDAEWTRLGPRSRRPPRPPAWHPAAVSGPSPRSPSGTSAGASASTRRSSTSG